MSNPLPGGLRKRGNYFFENGHWCDACHNVSDVQVRTKGYDLSRQRMIK